MTSIQQTSATNHAIATYTTGEEPPDHGMAICLSGGGYRAALFHLGALRRLNELGILSQAETISSVSGGSIVNGLLADQSYDWPPAGGAFRDWDERIADPLRQFTQRNIRTGAIARRLLPWNWPKSDAPVEELGHQYRRLNSRLLSELPDRPRFIFCATDINFGVNWIFDSGGRVGDYQAGYIAPPGSITVAQAMSASSCFPPVFNPLHLGIPPDQLHHGSYAKPDRDELARNIGLSDGGVYDNFGLEPVWKDHRCLLVSDGGGVFEGERDTGLLWRIQRYTGIQGSQVSALRKRWLISNFISGQLAGTYWGIGSSADHYGFEGPYYSEQLVDDVISEVRTDLDAFSEAEQAVLENHGYIMAEAATRRHVPDMIAIDAPFALPHPAWMDHPTVRRALRDSNRRVLLGRSR